ncbi:PP2C family protein-serine/threonine phosphatase [Streptomyces sp. CA-111067]|uniref:PP2C family protein-serine/threonine phosphatase n=1 Tax=Streptomyces sp. CA-111067 TaxID=3240046 RepID=UPI003D99379E
MTTPSLLTVLLSSEHDVFTLRRQAKTAAEAAGLEPRQQVRLATTLSELGRDLLRTAVPMTASFALDEPTAGRPASLRVELAWTDDREPSEDSLRLVAKLLPMIRCRPADGGLGAVEVACPLPQGADLKETAEAVSGVLNAATGPSTALDDLRAQTIDLISALEESRTQRDELERLNTELAETNQGVMALYTELSAELEETNRGVVALYGEEHQLALTLQRTFLPGELPRASRVELAVRYIPATAEAEIGGDFYEAVVTPAGLLLAVGDVVGHSLQAAVVMGELRHALRAYAAEDHPPHVLLERLDHLLRLHQPGWSATLCVVLVEPGAAAVQIANGGHLPPLLVAPGESGDFLHPHGPMLGLGLPQPEATRHPVKPDSILLMVTDGLIETRDEDLLDRMEQLRQEAAAGPSGPNALCDHLLDVFGSGPEDDLIVFAVHLDPPSDSATHQSSGPVALK